jgi:hypothetical protein
MHSSTYADVIPVMQAAAASPRGVRFRMRSWSTAFNFRQRCYRYRALFRKEEALRMQHIPGYVPSTPYDTLEVVVEGIDGTRRSAGCPEEFRSQPHDVVLKHKTANGELLDADGQPLALEPEPHFGLDIE